MDNSFYYWIGFLLYSFTVISIGFHVWKKEKKSGHASDNQSYWAASKNLSGWSVGYP